MANIAPREWHTLDLPPVPPGERRDDMPPYAPEAPLPAQGTRSGQILRIAAGIVDGARNATHGDKERSFGAIAALWTAYLNAKPHADRVLAVTPADVCAMMVLLKFARSDYGRHVEDHGVDAAGYAAIWGELREAGR